MLDDCGAAFDPVAAVAVEHAVGHSHLGMVDVAADDAVEATPLRILGERGLEPVDGLHRLLDLPLQPLAKRPVRVAQQPAHRVEPAVDDQRGAVGAVAEDGQELGVAQHAVELVAVDDQQLQPGGRHVDRLAADLDAGDLEGVRVLRWRQPGAEHFVVVARNVGDRRPALGHAQDRAEHAVMVGVPIPGLAEAPAIDDVADQEKVLAVHPAQEIGEEVATAALGSEMGIRNEHGTVVEGAVGTNSVHATEYLASQALQPHTVSSRCCM